MELPNEHLDANGDPWIITEKNYWKNSIYVMTGISWFLIGFIIGFMLPL